MDEVESGDSSGAVRTGAPSGHLKGIGLRVKCPELDRGVGGKAGTGGGVPVGGASFHVTEGVRERRRKNVFFFLTDTSDR